MARAQRVASWPPPAVQQAPPHGPTAADRLQKIITDAGPDAITYPVPAAVARGVLEALELAEQGKRRAEHDARAARETTKWANEKADGLRDEVSQLTAHLRTARKQAAREAGV